MIFDHDPDIQGFLYLNLEGDQPKIEGRMYRKTKDGDYEIMNTKGGWSQCRDSTNPFFRHLGLFLTQYLDFITFKEKIPWMVVGEWYRDAAPKVDEETLVDYSLYDKVAEWLETKYNNSTKVKTDDGLFESGDKTITNALESIEYVL